MGLKKFLAASMAGAMILTASSFMPHDFDFGDISKVEAAKGGGKINFSKNTPKVDLKKTPPATSSNTKNQPSANESKSVSGGGREYQPSKNAKDLKNNPSTAAGTTQNTGSRFGNMLRNVGLFAGGMMLGGLLSSLLGDFGSGFFAEVLGLIFNIIMIYAVYRGVRYIWGKFNKNKDRASSIQSDYKQPIDITPPQAMNYPNQTMSLGSDYDPKRTADKYRSL